MALIEFSSNLSKILLHLCTLCVQIAKICTSDKALFLVQFKNCKQKNKYIFCADYSLFACFYTTVIAWSKFAAASIVRMLCSLYFSLLLQLMKNLSLNKVFQQLFFSFYYCMIQLKNLPNIV